MDGVALRDIRQQLGMSQRDLAQELSVSANTVARWERGEMTIRHPRVLERALNDVRRQAQES